MVIFMITTRVNPASETSHTEVNVLTVQAPVSPSRHRLIAAVTCHFHIQ